MNIYICIDDTDILGTPGTGHLADAIRLEIEERGWGKTRRISRHQLYVHEKVPFTSHNSAMCFSADILEGSEKAIKELVIQRLLEGSVEGSDPGFCMAIEEKIQDKASLLSWGRRAKCSVLTKEEAYKTAEKAGVHLSEHGGTGQGIIGALAGVGLRLYGNDGRIKGKTPLERTGMIMSAGELKRICRCNQVLGIDGAEVADEDSVLLVEDRLKCVWLGWKETFPVVCCKTGEAKWQSLTKVQSKIY